jgi:hypothetical protein
MMGKEMESKERRSSRKRRQQEMWMGFGEQIG